MTSGGVAKAWSGVGGAAARERKESSIIMSALSYAWSQVHAAFGGSEFLMLTFGEIPFMAASVLYLICV